MNPTSRLAIAFAACAALLSGAAAHAQDFAALVAPPRFEAAVQPGGTYRNVIEIHNVSRANARYSVQTADWTLDERGTAAFSEALAADSCRPWVGLEAAEITVAPNAKRRFRYEVAVPADAPAGECRFAIMIEGDAKVAPGSVAIPVAGRIGVIVYLAVGNAKPRLELLGQSVQTVQDRAVPVLRVRNAGNAHGRLEGLVDGTDADGRRYAFASSGLPILPGETRAIALAPQADSDTAPAPTIRYPLRLKGQYDTGAQALPIDATLTQ